MSTVTTYQATTGVVAVVRPRSAKRPTRIAPMFQLNGTDLPVSLGQASWSPPF